ncbi:MULTISPECIES: hypothetical protein [Enterococcus]|uniref:Uncharacterized protein n=1 Tax=Enterococcus alishanensis TaxID=1303817 RepID=A0ABS6TB14_9ENTE|nr:hypothetical protein [Enterococcus alishanensis]MBV7390091.1 hypothetical protein [Enterococcus alishanensis]
MTYRKMQLGLVAFGTLCFIYNLYEFFISKYSTKQGIIFLIECLAGIVLIFLPEIANKLLKIVIPDKIVYFYWFFLIISVFLGTSLHMISIISFWDKILHAVSPMVLTALGYGLIGILMKNASINKTSPWLFLLFGFAFAGTCGVFWEFWEFLCDTVANMNLQRYATSGGTLLVGRAALMDTMGDLLTNTIGALIMGIYAWFASRNKPEYFEGYRLSIRKKTSN